MKSVLKNPAAMFWIIFTVVVMVLYWLVNYSDSALREREANYDDSIIKEYEAEVIQTKERRSNAGNTGISHYIVVSLSNGESIDGETEFVMGTGGSQPYDVGDTLTVYSDGLHVERFREHIVAYGTGATNHGAFIICLLLIVAPFLVFVSILVGEVEKWKE